MAPGLVPGTVSIVDGPQWREVAVAICRIGREPIEHIDGSWGPSERNVHDGACTPALVTTIELIPDGRGPVACYWCAWDGPAVFYLNGKGCCESHVLRAMNDVSAVLEARGVIRGASIERP